MDKGYLALSFIKYLLTASVLGIMPGVRDPEVSSSRDALSSLSMQSWVGSRELINVIFTPCFIILIGNKA